MRAKIPFSRYTKLICVCFFIFADLILNSFLDFNYKIQEGLSGKKDNRRRLNDIASLSSPSSSILSSSINSITSLESSIQYNNILSSTSNFKKFHTNIIDNNNINNNIQDKNILKNQHTLSSSSSSTSFSIDSSIDSSSESSYNSRKLTMIMNGSLNLYDLILFFVQLLFQLFILFLIFLFITDTFLFRVGLVNILFRKINTFFIIQIIYFVFTIVNGILRLQTLDYTLNNNDNMIIKLLKSNTFFYFSLVHNIGMLLLLIIIF